MRLGDDGDRSNVEDRRGAARGAGVKLGLGGTVLLVVLSVVFKQDMFALLGGSGATSSPSLPAEEVQRRTAAEASLEKIAVGSFNDSQRVWTRSVKGYRPAKLVLFWDEVR
jgi:predicted metalloprotease